MPTALGNLLTGWARRSKDTTARLDVLHPMDFNLEPGTMTLVLGPPGAGKSQVLRAVASNLQNFKGGSVTGTVSYNGRTAEDLKASVSNVVKFGACVCPRPHSTCCCACAHPFVSLFYVSIQHAHPHPLPQPTNLMTTCPC